MTNQEEWKVETVNTRQLEEELNTLAKAGYEIEWVAPPSTEQNYLWTIVAKRATPSRIDEFVEEMLEKEGTV